MVAEITYLTAYVNDPKKVLEFLVKHLGFFDHRRIGKRYVGKQGVLVSNRFGNNYLLVPATASIAANSNSNEPIIFNTDNCIRDYHQLMNAGIKIEQVPKYRTKGLELVISDNYGNRYLLLEKRDYQEI
jgi:hypothetical protein